MYSHRQSWQHLVGIRRDEKQLGKRPDLGEGLPSGREKEPRANWASIREKNIREWIAGGQKPTGLMASRRAWTEPSKTSSTGHTSNLPERESIVVVSSTIDSVELAIPVCDSLIIVASKADAWPALIWIKAVSLYYSSSIWRRNLLQLAVGDGRESDRSWASPSGAKYLSRFYW